MARGDLLLGGGSLISGIGGLIAGATGQQDTPPTPTSTFLPGADPLLAALSGEGLLGLGQFDPTVIEAASPVRQLVSQILSLPEGIASEREKQRGLAMLTKAQNMGLFARFDQAVQAGQFPPDIDSFWSFLVNQPHFVFGPEQIAELSESGVFSDNGMLQSSLLNANGGKRVNTSEFKSLGKLMGIIQRLGVIPGQLASNEARFTVEAPKLQAKQEELAQQVLEGRIDAQQATAAIQSDLSAIASGDFGRINQIPFVEGLRGNIELERSRSERDIRARAGVAGSNPGASLRAIDEQAFNLNNQVPANATGQLLQVLAGLQGSTQIGFENAATASGQRSNERISAAQIAAQQQAAFTNAATAAGANNATNLGGGINAAFNSLGNAAFGIGLLNRGPGAPDAIPTAPRPIPGAGRVNEFEPNT